MNFKVSTNSNSFPYFYFFIVSLIIGIIFVQFAFKQDFNKLLTQVKTTLIDFSQQKEDSISQFLNNYSPSLNFTQSKDLINTIHIIDSNGQQLPMDDLRKLLYVEQQQKLRLNAYLVNNQGDLLTAQKEFDTSSTRSTAKIIRNELISQCLNEDNPNQSNFYTGIDEGNRSVYGTYQKVSSQLPLCLFSETEKVTNIDLPAQQILKTYIFWGLFIVFAITLLGMYLSNFSSPFSVEEIISFILCGTAGISYIFLITLITRGANYFSLNNYLLELSMATLSFSLLIIICPFSKCRYLKVGALLLGIYFLLTIFFEEFRQSYELSSTWRNLILVLIRFFSIGGFLSLFFGFKKNIKL